MAAQTTKITNIEQMVGSLVARVTSLETNTASGSSSPDLARSWNMLGQSNGSTATGSLGSHGPGSSDDNRNIRRRLDTFTSPQDEHAHVSNTTLELRIGSITFEKNQTFQSIIIPSSFIAKQVPSVSARLVFETRVKCQDFVARYKDDGIPYEIDSPFCCAKTTISVRQSQSLEDRKIGKQFAPLWRVLAEQLKILFPDGDDEGAFIVPAHDARSQVLSFKDRRKGVGKPVFKLAPFGSGQLFTLVAPDLCVPGVSPEVLQRVLSQASTANV